MSTSAQSILEYKKICFSLGEKINMLVSKYNVDSDKFKNTSYIHCIAKLRVAVECEVCQKIVL